ncbi:hypothetical protein HDU89_005838 [Geranomyces variabilis]|nr:hypothetical protein HDU89_005838 [Geranomyces variabilis]
MLWFVNPAQQPLAWLDYLSTTIGAAAIASEGEAAWHGRYVQKLHENINAIPENTQKTRKAKLRALHNEFQQKVARGAYREMYATIINDADIMAAARPAAKVGSSCLASSVVFISRATKDTSPQYQRHVDLMDEMHMKVFCPLSVTALFDDLSKMPMGPEVGKIERHTNATKDINCMMLGTDDATTYAVDVIGVFGGDNAELLFLEQSGGSCFEKSRPHAKDDSIKVANESINGLRARLCKFLDVLVELAKKVRSYAMQLIGSVC